MMNLSSWDLLPFAIYGSGETRPQGAQTSRFVQMFQGRGASVPRSRRRCRSHARRFNPAGFSFGFGGCGKLLLLRLALRRRWRNLPRKSGGPPLFALSLKVERNIAHNRAPGSLSCPGATTLNAHRPLKVLQRRASMRWRRSALREPASQTRTSDFSQARQSTISGLENGQFAAHIYGNAKGPCRNANGRSYRTRWQQITLGGGGRARLGD